MMRSALVRKILESWLGIDSRRTLPPIAPVGFETWFRNRPRPASSSPRPGVVLFHDTFMSFSYPEIGQAATQLLERAGYEVVLADRVCCGRPMISKGLVDEARAHAAHNARELGRWIRKGYTVVGCEPSCLLTFRDEYPDLIGADASPLASASFLLEEFISREKAAGRWQARFLPTDRSVLLQTHCHQKALIGSQTLRDVLGMAYQVEEVDAGCCGMAGAFGYEREHYPISVDLASRRLLPAIASRPGAILVAPGVSCRQQVLDLAGRRALHPAEALAEALETDAAPAH